MAKFNTADYDIGYPIYGAKFLNDQTLLVTGGGGEGEGEISNRLTALTINLEKKKKPIKKFRELKLDDSNDAPSSLDSNNNIILLGCNEGQDVIKNGQNNNLQKFIYIKDHLKFITTTSLETRSEQISASIYQKFITISRDGSIAAIASSSTPTVIHILDPVNLFEKYEIETNNEVRDLDISPDGKNLTYITKTNTIEIISIITGKSLLRRIDFNPNINLNKVKFVNNDHVLLGVSSKNEIGVGVIKLSLNAKLKTIKQDLNLSKKIKSITSIDINSKNGVISLSGNENSIILLKLESLKKIKVFNNVHSLSISKLTSSPNGKLLASVSVSNTVNIIEIPDALGIETHYIYYFFLRSFQVLVFAVLVRLGWWWYETRGSTNPVDFSEYFTLNQRSITTGPTSSTPTEWSGSQITTAPERTNTDIVEEIYEEVRREHSDDGAGDVEDDETETFTSTIDLTESNATEDETTTQPAIEEVTEASTTENATEEPVVEETTEESSTTDYVLTEEPEISTIETPLNTTPSKQVTTPPAITSSERVTSTTESSNTEIEFATEDQQLKDAIPVENQYDSFELPPSSISKAPVSTQTSVSHSKDEKSSESDSNLSSSSASKKKRKSKTRKLKRKKKAKTKAAPSNTSTLSTSSTEAEPKAEAILTTETKIIPISTSTKGIKFEIKTESEQVRETDASKSGTAADKVKEEVEEEVEALTSSLTSKLDFGSSSRDVKESSTEDKFSADFEKEIKLETAPDIELLTSTEGNSLKTKLEVRTVEEEEDSQSDTETEVIEETQTSSPLTSLTKSTDSVPKSQIDEDSVTPESVAGTSPLEIEITTPLDEPTETSVEIPESNKETVASSAELKDVGLEVDTEAKPAPAVKTKQFIPETPADGIELNVETESDTETQSAGEADDEQSSDEEDYISTDDDSDAETELTTPSDTEEEIPTPELTDGETESDGDLEPRTESDSETENEVDELIEDEPEAEEVHEEDFEESSSDDVSEPEDDSSTESAESSDSDLEDVEVTEVTEEPEKSTEVKDPEETDSTEEEDEDYVTADEAEDEEDSDSSEESSSDEEVEPSTEEELESSTEPELDSDDEYITADEIEDNDVTEDEDEDEEYFTADEDEEIIDHDEL